MADAKDYPTNHLTLPTDNSRFRTDRGQGNRWHCITDKFAHAQNLVQHIISNSWLDKRVCYEYEKARRGSTSEIYCLHYPEKTLQPSPYCKARVRS